jgi:diadenosine tetraphosphate (Ap4A) HIT family hydrolase
MNQFTLHPNLAPKPFIVDLPLCSVLLENEVHYPWLLLVPRVSGVERLFELTFDQQVQLLKELDLAQKILWKLFQPKQLNVAAIGNKTPQLHVHVIARTVSDPAWPHTVWDHPVRAQYSVEELSKVRHLLQQAFE